MKKLFLMMALSLIFLVAGAGSAAAVTLAWDRDTETWTESTEVAVLVREQPTGEYKVYPERFNALQSAKPEPVAALDNKYFEAGKTYYVTVAAIANGYMSGESNQVELVAVHEDPLTGVPVMEQVSPPGLPALLRAQ